MTHAIVLGGEKHEYKEFSTFDWIIEEMLHKSGFKFDIHHKDDFFCSILLQEELSHEYVEKYRRSNIA
jgi:hypothetical protein